MKVSFIIPVYKVEQYLSQCVESITSQTYRDIEIILVDDGSPGGCPALCDSLAVNDDRIKVVHKENGGLSDARNAGLRVATGDYVVFVDGDDFWMEKGALDKLVSFVEKHVECDFVGYNCSYYYQDTNSYSPWVKYDDSLSESTSGSEAMTLLVKSGTFPMSACLKIIKREFLVKNELYFVKGQIAEDIPWFINLLDKCDKCGFVNYYIYAYRQNVAGSITNSGGDRSFRSLLNIVKSEVAKVEQRQLTQSAKESLYSFLAYELCILFTYSNIDAKTKKELKSYSWLIRYDTNPKVRRVKMVKKFIGLPLTIKLLKYYNQKRINKR